MYEFLQDQLFLHQLDNLKVREEFIKITVLSWQEDPIQEIQGKVISGSLNIDGNSSLRRTANLTVFAEELVNDLTQIDDLLSINRKIKLELGIVNTVPNFQYDAYDENRKRNFHYTIDYQKEYGDIVWFPLGYFVIFDPNISHSTTGVNISLTLKDKMCLLNGDAGGVIPAAVELHTREQEGPDGETYIDNPTIRQIIFEVVNHWGEEDLSRIIVSDVDERIKQVVQWSGSTPLYHWTQQQGNDINEMYSLTYPAGINPEDLAIYEMGQDVGFILTDFTYPGELVGDVGQTVTSVLDQIIQVLGNYEYFYDVYGNFRFQEIKNYLNTTYTSYQSYGYNSETEARKNQYSSEELKPDVEQHYLLDLSGGMPVYKFVQSPLVSAFSNAPQYSNVKNDFVVWGVRTDSLGNQFPIRYHLAIDKRPQKVQLLNEDGTITNDYYGEHKGMDLYTDEFDIVRARSYIMHFATKMDFPRVGYTDRIYYAVNEDAYYEWHEQGSQSKYVRAQDLDWHTTIRTKDWREELYYQGLEATNTASDFPYYYTELIEEWPKLYDLEKQKFKESVIKDPSTIDFYLDIIDSGTEIGKYSVSNIGRRSTAVNEDGINCVFEQEVPDIVFIEANQDDIDMQFLKDECDKMGQKYTQVDSDVYSLLIIGGWQNSAYQRVCEMLYQYTNMNNNITITSMPIYYLEPNTRIQVEDPPAGIYGDYIIQSISLPLDINSQMSITANKALQKI